MSQGQQAVVAITPIVHCTVSVQKRDHQHPQQASVLSHTRRHRMRVARSKRANINVGCKWAATRTHALYFQNNRTATSVPSPTEQPQCPSVKCASYHHRRIDRSSNSVDQRVTVPNTQHSTPLFTPYRTDVARSTGCACHKANRILCRYNREITNVLSKRLFFHTSGRHKTRVARSKREKFQCGLQMGSNQDARPVFPEQQNHKNRSIANRAAAVPQRQMRIIPSPPNRSVIKFS
jgi:hypothetical protein